MVNRLTRFWLKQRLTSAKSCIWALLLIVAPVALLFMASTEGGVEIEKVAEETPHLIHKIALDPLAGPMPYQGRELAFQAGPGR